MIEDLKQPGSGARSYNGLPEARSCWKARCIVSVEQDHRRPLRTDSLQQGQLGRALVSAHAVCLDSADAALQS